MIQYSETVFAAGDGFPIFRIPSLITTQKGTLLAFAEGRESMKDQAMNKIGLKRSIDNGKTWGPLQIIAKSGNDCLNNPNAVIDETTGRIILIFQLYPEGMSEFRIPKSGEIGSPLRDIMIYSDDDGITWSEFRDITKDTKEPTALTIASGPGIGIQISKGPYKGRILIPYNQRHKKFNWTVYTTYSDDGGKTWVRGKAAKNDGIFTGGNEVQIAEKSDGNLYLNCRHWGFTFPRASRCRRISESNDGGETWSKLKKEPHLIESQCQGSLIKYPLPGKEGKQLFLFANPQSKIGRYSGTLYASMDDGKTWPFQFQLVKGYFAYSSLTILSNGDIGLVYESGSDSRYDSIVFLCISPNKIFEHFQISH